MVHIYIYDVYIYIFMMYIYIYDVYIYHKNLKEFLNVFF